MLNNLVHSLYWGTVPSWLAAISLGLAFRVFKRDRAAAERHQIDRLGHWDGVSVVSHDEATVKVVCGVSNSSDLPIEVHSIHIALLVRWAKSEPFGDGGFVEYHGQEVLKRTLSSRRQQV